MITPLLSAEEELMEHEFQMSLKECLPVDDVREELELLANSMSSQKALAHKIGISVAYLSDVLRGRREPGPKILKFLKLKRVVMYVEEK